MMKYILFISMLVVILQAQDFETFLADSLQRSPLLKSDTLSLEQADENIQIDTRYKNPTISLEVSNFNSDYGSSDIGYRASLSQPIRLWGVLDDREDLAKAKKQEILSTARVNRATFVKELSSLYSRYKRAVNATILAKKELRIAKNIANISKERFENGTIARVKYTQASLDFKRAKNFLAQTMAKKTTAYFRLMGYRGLNEEVDLDTSYEIKLIKNDTIENAQLKLSKAKTAKAEARAELNSHKLEWVALSGEFEQEPDQNIARVGVDIPLAIFNTKTQERQIAKLEAKKSELISQNLTQALMFKLRELEESVKTLEVVEQTSSQLLKSQEELLEVYEQSYKIANIDLIELQIIKNQLIETKENLLQVTLEKELNIIQHNFLTGAYNE